MGVNVKLLQAVARANNQKRDLEAKGWKNVKVRNPHGNPRTVFVRGTPPNWKKNVRRVKPDDLEA